MHPTVTVLIPVYNAKQHLHQAIESILAQTYSNFELLIMDDGSTDNSTEIIKSFDDKRIRYHISPINNGIEQTLNDGIRKAKGTYIARMDADDISHPDRLRQQVFYMEANPKTGVLGTAIRKLKNNRTGKIITPPQSDRAIRVELLFHNPISHPSVMLRKSSIAETLYPVNTPYAEDYSFWVVLSLTTHFANLSVPLHYYRVHDQQITQNKQNISRQSKIRILDRYLNILYPFLNSKDRHNCLNAILACNHQPLQQTCKWLEKIAAANMKNGALDQTLLMKQLGKKWFDCCRKSREKSRDMHAIFTSTQLCHHAPSTLKNKFKYILRRISP